MKMKQEIVLVQIKENEAATPPNHVHVRSKLEPRIPPSEQNGVARQPI
jgi:hypothetical protein